MGYETVKGEPPRPRWRRDGSIRRDDLKKHGITEAQQQIVGCHARVFAADLRRNPKVLENEGGAGFQ